MSLKEKINEYLPTDKNIHILFYEQTVCKRGTKWKKAYLISIGNIATWLSGSVRE